MTKITTFFQQKRTSSSVGNAATTKRERDDEVATENNHQNKYCTTLSKRSRDKIRGNDENRNAVTELLSYLNGNTKTADGMSDPTRVGWTKALEKHFQSAAFARLAEFVATERATQTIYPVAADIWSALNVCPLESIKVVIVGQDPYHGPNQAHGLCFSVLPGQAAPPSLKNMSVQYSHILA